MNAETRDHLARDFRMARRVGPMANAMIVALHYLRRSRHADAATTLEAALREHDRAMTEIEIAADAARRVA